MQYKHTMSMLAFGKMRIGTLRDFQKVEEYGSEVGDAGEGTKTVYEDKPDIFWGEANVPPLVKRLVSFPDNTTATFRNCEFQHTQKSPDCYIYCVTQEFDKDAMTEFGYDCCIRINDPHMFFHELTKCLRRIHKLKQSVIGKCIYTNRRQHYSLQDNIPPGLIKPPRFAYQKEVRAMWIPQDREIQPIFVSCPQATQYCSMHPLQ